MTGDLQRFLLSMRGRCDFCGETDDVLHWFSLRCPVSRAGNEAMRRLIADEINTEQPFTRLLRERVEADRQREFIVPTYDQREGYRVRVRGAKREKS